MDIQYGTFREKGYRGYVSDRKLRVRDLTQSPMVLPSPVVASQELSQSLIIPTASMFSTICNLINSMFGAGILSLPFAFSQTGVFWGTFMFIMVAICQGITVHMVNRCVINQRKYSFRALAAKTFREVPYAQVIMELIIAVNCFGFSVSYLIIIGDILPDVIEGVSGEASQVFKSREFWITIVGVLFCFPLMFLKTIDSLRYTSMISIFGITYIVILCVLMGFGVMDPCEGATQATGKCPGTFHIDTPGTFFDAIKVLSIYIFAYACTQNVPIMAYELKNRSIEKLKVINITAMTFVTFIYMTFAFFGYFAFGNYMTGDLLKVMPDTMATTLARVAIGITVISCFALQMQPTKNSVAQMIWHTDAYHLTRKQFLLLVLGLFGSAWLIALFVNDLSIALSFIGATTSMSIGFVLPCYFFIKLSKNQNSWEKKFTQVLFYASLVSIPVLLSIELFKIFS